MDFEIKKIELDDKRWMNRYLDCKADKGCDLCFSNIYLWKRKYPTGYAMVEDCLVFWPIGRPEGAIFPLGKREDIRRAVLWLERYFAGHGQPFMLNLATATDFELLNRWFPGRYRIEYYRDSADYVYETEKLASLSGRRYHGKKNHINKFMSLYPDWSYEAITKENVEECFTMALEWRRLNGCEEDEDKRDEICVTLNALRLMEELSLEGGLIRAQGRVVAFSIGERLNPDTYVVHIEKAYADVPGAYPLINQQFVLHAAMDYTYVNREDDSGVEGLRKAKESYHPAFLLEKGVITHA